MEEHGSEGESPEVGRPRQEAKERPAEAEVLGWRQGGPRRSVKGTLSRPGGCPGAVSELVGLLALCSHKGHLRIPGTSEGAPSTRSKQ